MFWSAKVTLALLLIALFACGGSDSDSAERETDIGGNGGAAGTTDQSCGQIGEGSVSLGGTCEPLSTVYPGDSWMSCVSDDGNWNLAGESAPSSAARFA